MVVAKKSTDNTYNLAKEAGAKVIYDTGEGHGAAKRLGIKALESCPFSLKLLACRYTTSPENSGVT